MKSNKIQLLASLLSAAIVLAGQVAFAQDSTGGSPAPAAGNSGSSSQGTSKRLFHRKKRLRNAIKKHFNKGNSGSTGSTTGAPAAQ